MLLDVCRIRIGAHTLIGPAVQIYTPLHPLEASERRKAEYGKPVTIGSDVWIGGGAIVLRESPLAIERSSGPAAWSRGMFRPTCSPLEIRAGSFVRSRSGRFRARSRHEAAEQSALSPGMARSQRGAQPIQGAVRS